MVMNQRGLRCLLLVGAVAIGCGDDDGSNMEVDGGPRAGASGASGSAGSGTGGSAGGTATVQPVPCGDTMCPVPQSPLSALTGFLPPGLVPPGLLPMPAPCCLDEDSNMCGVAPMVGGACAAPATRDQRCAGINVMLPGGAPGAGALGGLGFGCCTATDQCGIDGSIFGLGCVESGMATAQLGPLAGFLMLPAPKSCDAPLPTAGAGGAGGAGADGGVDSGIDGGAGTGGDEDAGS